LSTPVVVVFAIPGRESVTAATVAALEGRGGGSQLDCERILFWSAATAPIDVPAPWRAVWHVQDKRGSAAALGDFWAMLDVVGDRDLIFCEDDVMPCTNALRFMAAWDGPHVTHFFNPMSQPFGPRILPPGGFEFAQTLKIPARIVAFLRADPPTSRGLKDGWDLAIGRCLHRLGEPLFQHRSLVQHVGFTSMWTPGNNLAKRRPARDWPGEDFDALSLLDPRAPA
jgi:hypothetical protein